MTKINEELDDESDNILWDFQKSHGLSTRGKALNALLKDYARKGQLWK
jgi:hypothetical protein